MADTMHRRRTVEYPQHGGGMHHPDMKRRYSPDHADDMRGRKRMRFFVFILPAPWQNAGYFSHNAYLSWYSA